ncbi:hypothetical protein AADZ90_010655 [Aestuariibius sp. 2305UL40-4]|uniref:hypothetical protein n=1 Tax=Aestuariibius violaceus TaxID=3234132 RepID=UPI0034775526
MLAEGRARHLQEFTHFDLDGDLAISAAEVDRQLPFLPANRKADLLALVIQVDRDGDRGLSTQEILAEVNRRAERTHNGARNATRLLEFDIDGNKEVTAEEIIAAVRSVNQGERDSITSLRPTSPATLSITMAPTIRQIPGFQQSPAVECDLPPVPANAEIVMLSAFGGASLSNLAIASQDRVTTTGTLTIEDGEAPLYVVNLSQNTVIWQFEGATDRIAALVVGVWRNGTGVTGLEDDRIHFIPGQDCLPSPFRDGGGGDALRANAMMSARLARAPDHVVTPGTVNQVALPSGEVLVAGTRSLPGPIIVSNGRRTVLTEDGPVSLDAESGSDNRRLEAQLITDLSRQHPGGIASLDPDDVIASGSVEPYEVLPRTAGLQQLIRDGAITRTSDGYYHIVKPIPRFPAGLHGGHRLRFILGTGVPMPAGSPGHSPVYSEETGECIGGSIMCR